MSSNNFISINKKQENAFEVEEKDADSGDRIYLIGTYGRAETALEAAQEYMDENDVEYGISYYNPTTKDTRGE